MTYTEQVFVARTKGIQRAEKHRIGPEVHRVKGPLVIEPSRMTFSIVNTDADIVRIVICGRFDESMIGVFRRELTNLLRIHPGCVDVDMSRLRFIDRAGVELLLAFFRDLSERGGRTVVHGLRTQPLNRFKAILAKAALAKPGPVN